MSDQTTQAEQAVETRAPRKWNMRIYWPTDWYQVRVKEVSFSPSKGKGNPQVTLSLEVVAPETVDNGEDLVTVSGVPLEYYLPVTIFKEGSEEVDQKKTADCRTKYSEFLEKMQLPPVEDWDNPSTTEFIGIVFYAMLKAKRDEKRRSPTAAQKAKGEKGDILTDPITGEKSVTYYPNVDEVSARVS